MNIEDKYLSKFEELMKLQSQIEHIHPLLQHRYPVLIVEDNHLNIFDYDPHKKGYRLQHVEPDTIHLPQGIRAAFPMQSYGGKAIVVVSGDVFDSTGEQVTIFHENVHCYQYETCELKLRENIALAQKAKKEGDYSWELNYPFPYEDSEFAEYVPRYFQAIQSNDEVELRRLRRSIKEHLTGEQVEYMVWQEWKEGYARYIENLIKKYLGIEEMHKYSEPYNRTLFYETGSQLIQFLQRSGKDVEDIESLYYVMNEEW